MATGKSFSETMGTAVSGITEHIAKWGPVLAILGIMESHEKEGKTTFVANREFVGHAKSKILGVGLDDEAIMAAILGQFAKECGLEKSQTIHKWLLTLEKHQQARFRLGLSKMVSEFSEKDTSTEKKTEEKKTEPNKKDGGDKKNSEEKKPEPTKETTTVKMNRAAGMKYAIDFLADLASESDKTSYCISLNIIGEKPPLTEQAWKKAKKINVSKVPQKAASVLRKINDELGF